VRLGNARGKIKVERRGACYRFRFGRVDRPAIVIGETVGSYKLLAKLGAGGMDEVYLAEHKYIARRAAIKFLLPELSRSAAVVGRFFNEARAASMIEHPGIVEVLDCEVHSDGRAFIVMELLRGEDLRRYMERNGKLDGDLQGALGICRQMTAALAAAQAQGIVHRDLKPDNVFLHVPAGRAPVEPIVKLLDFGIAKLQGGGEAGTHTRTGQLLGTPIYMSPEQCRGARQVDRPSDIYSLGCIMFELFCGRPPFVAEGVGDLMMGHISQPPPDPRDLSPRITPAIQQVLLRCLEKEPAARPVVSELAALLEAAGAREGARLKLPVLTPEPGAATPAPAARSPHESTMPEAGGTKVLPEGPVPTPVGRRVLSPRPGAGARPSQPTPPATTLGGGAVEVHHVQAGGRRRWRWIALGAVSLAGLAAVLTVVLSPAPPDMRSARDADRQRTPAATGESIGTVPPVQPEPTQPPGPRPRPETVTITLTGLPSDAVIRLDGRLASSPLVVPSGEEMHKIAVESDGFERWEQSVDGTSNKTLPVRLKPKSPEARDVRDGRDARDGKSKAKAKGKQRSDRGHGSQGFTGFSDL
jgi:serine/threonine-protein kinase